MNCWEILGIDPTGDRERIRTAYENQRKFASEEEEDRLLHAYHEALGEQPPIGSGPQSGPDPDEQQADSRDLTPDEKQVVHEVDIQIRALLNDSVRWKDVQIWKAILCEPPADQLPLRRAIAADLEQQVRPMAENGSFPPPVVQFLSEWFDWFGLQDKPPHLRAMMDADEHAPRESNETREEESEQQPQMENFWPAVIGWVVGLLILASLFGGMGGGGG